MKKIKHIMLAVLLAVLLTGSSVYVDTATAQPVKAPQNTSTQVQYKKAAPLSIVNNPKAYLNCNVIMQAKFDKFSTLGLDYKPAFKSSEDYISFLIKRDDTSYNIPLSEMKLFLKRDKAEKFIDLKTGDEIEIQGKMFSDALGDAWIEVNDLKILQKAPEQDKK